MTHPIYLDHNATTPVDPLVLEVTDTALVSVMHANNEVGTLQPIAPKGVGALYVRPWTPLRAVLDGADQEHGLRPGTENVALIVGLGAAARMAHQALPALTGELRQRRDQLHRMLADRIPGLQLNGHSMHRLPNTLHVSFPGVTGRALLEATSSLVAASLGSACHSAQDAVSGVLAAMNVDAARAAGSVRLSVGRSTSQEEVELAGLTLIEAWQGMTR